MPEVKLIRKFLKFSAIVLLIFLFGFSDIVSFFLPQDWQSNKLAESLKI